MIRQDSIGSFFGAARRSRLPTEKLDNFACRCQIGGGGFAGDGIAFFLLPCLGSQVPNDLVAIVGPTRWRFLPEAELHDPVRQVTQLYS